MESWLATGTSKWTLTKAPGIGGLHGKKSGWPSSMKPVNRLHMGFVPKSGRLLPTRTTIVAGLLAPDNGKHALFYYHCTFTCLQYFYFYLNYVLQIWLK